MNKTQIKAAIIGGLIVFVWGMFSWMVFPWHQSALLKFKNEADVAQVIRENAREPGIYILPNTFSYSEGTSHKEMMRGVDMMEKGPFMFANVCPQGLGPMSLRPFVFSLLLQMAGAFIVTWMLIQTRGLSFNKQVGFAALFGTSVALLGQLPDWNWWGFSSCYVMINMADLIVGWTLAGMGIAKLLKK